MIRLEKLEGVLLISFLLFFCFSLLYIFRSFDNNTLVSWKWVFGAQGFTKILPYLFLCIVISLLLSYYIPFDNYPLPFLVIISGVAVLPLWNEPELLLDSGRYFLQAKNLSEYGTVFFLKQWGHAITAWTDMPLSPFLYGMTLKFGNESRMAIQLINTIIFILTVLITSRIGTILWNKQLGFYSGLILIGMPYLLAQVPQMLVDVHAMFFHALALLCFLEAIRQTNYSSLFVSSVTIVLAIFVKYSVWPLLALLPISAILFHSQGTYPKIFKRMALIFFPAAFVSATLFSLKTDVFAEQANILFSYQRPALKLWGEGMLSSLIFHCHPFIVMLSLFSIFRGIQLKDKRYVIILLYCSLIIILQIQRIRYMVPLLPFIALMASYGLAAFKEKSIRIFIACIIVSSSLTMLYAVYLPFFMTTSMMNIKMAGEALDKLESESVQVTVLPQVHSEGSSFVTIPLLDFFTDKRIISNQKWPNMKPANIPDHSPLLFTWVLNKPAFYELHDEENSAGTQAVISSEDTAHSTVQMDYASQEHKVYRFAKSSGAFRYQTFISVFN